MWNKAATVIFFIASVALVLGCYERYKESFQTLEEAKRSGIIEKGWLPSFLPPSAKDIHEVYDLDTNEVWGTFTFGKSDLKIVSGRVRELRQHDFTVVNIRAPGSIRWPDDLTGQLTVEDIRSWGLAFYEPEGGWLLVLEKERARGFFWRRPS